MAQTKAQLLGPVVGDVTIDTNTLSLDSEDNRVGIGTASATTKLHVKETINTAYSVTNVTDEPKNLLKLENASTTANAFAGMQFRVGSGADMFFGAIQQTTNAGDFYFANQNSPNVELMRIKSTGRVGIGTDNPQGQLAVVLNNNGLEFNPNSGQAIVSYNRATSAFKPVGLQGSTVGLYIGGVGEVLHIKSDGNLGIGTSSPTAPLHVLSSSYPTATIQRDHAVNYPRFRLINTSNHGADLDGIGDGSPAGGFRVSTITGGTSTERLRIYGDGTTRIRGVNRNSPFTVSNTTGTVFILDDTQPSAVGTGGKIVFGSKYYTASNTMGTAFIGSYKEHAPSNGSNEYNHSLIFGTNSANYGFLERLRIASNGQVLVGNYATHSSITGNLEVNGNDGINISNSYRTGTNGAQWRLIPHNGGSGQSPSNLRLYEGAGATEVINITKTGRIGVNRMAPSFMLDIVGNSSTGANCIRITDGAETGHGSHPAKIVAGGTYYHEMQMHSRRFAVHTYDGSSIDERFRIHQNGFVGINDTNPTRAISIKYNDSAAYSASGYAPNAGAIRIFNEATGSNITAGEILLGAGNSGTGWAAISCKRPGSQETELNFRVMDSATWNTGLTISKSAFVGIGVDSPAVKLDVKKATAGTIARFYDNGSNGGALYNGAPIMGLSRVSNGSVSLDGLFFQVGWDKNNSDSFNIDETVFAVGNKGVGIGEDDPQVMLHCSKGLSSTSSYKDAQMIRINGTNGVDTMAGIGFGYYTTNPSGSAYPSAWIGAKVSSWTQYVKQDLVFATRDVDTNTEPVERFRITEGNELKQAQDSQYWTYGNFTAGRSGQNATTAPRLAGSIAYGFGYQEAFSTSGGGWSHPYPDAVFGYHTGMRFGGHINYGGCRFYADHPSSNSSVLFSVGNGSYNVVVANTLSKGGGTFRIAHPHPSKKYTHDLQHSFIEGPQCDNLYRGKVDLVGGTASINIDTVSNMTDGTFVLLNRDIQCFTSNETGWTAVKGSVSGNILTITAQDNSCTDTVSWMVIGERQDDKIKSPEMEMTDSDGKLIVEPLTIEESHM